MRIRTTRFVALDKEPLGYPALKILVTKIYVAPYWTPDYPVSQFICPLVTGDVWFFFIQKQEFLLFLASTTDLGAIRTQF